MCTPSGAFSTVRDSRIGSPRLTLSCLIVQQFSLPCIDAHANPSATFAVWQSFQVRNRLRLVDASAVCNKRSRRQREFVVLLPTQACPQIVSMDSP
jgi:hypothetical protein